MILLFVATQGNDAPILPDLHIKDSSTSANIPVAGVEGFDDDFIQVLGTCNAPMVFAAEETLVASTETATYWCRRLSKVIAKVEFTAASANCVLFPVYHDKNDVKCIGDAVTVTATSFQDGSRYMASIPIVETYGANKISFYCQSISAGSVYLRAAGV